MDLIGAMSAVSSAIGMAKTAVDVRDETKIKDAIAEVSQKYGELCIAYSAVAQELYQLNLESIDLKRQLEEAHRNKEELQMYAYAEISKGVWVYQHIESGDSVGNRPCYCATCFHDKKLSPLQRKFKSWGYILVCHRCGSEISTGETADFSGISNRLAR